MLVVLLNQSKTKVSRNNTAESADKSEKRTLIEQNVKSQINWCRNPQKVRIGVPVFVQGA